jgi:hypothetical protein
VSNDPFFTPDIHDRFEALRDEMATAEKRLARYEAMLNELAEYFADRIDGEMIDGVPHMNRESTIHYEIQKVLA